MLYQRPVIRLLEERMSEPRRFIQVVMGPRQVGKTTLVMQLMKQANTPHRYVSADAIAGSDSAWIRQQWETARLQWAQSGAQSCLLVIDEIQKIPNWSETIKALWDEDTRRKVPLKLILLGSSRLLLQEGLTESLAGRFETIYMGHWSFMEMKKAFGWDENRFAWFGGYPGSAELIADEERWKKYVSDSLIESSISRDILMLTRVDKPALMRKLFELGCLYSGQILSYTKMLGQLLGAGNTTTLSHYLKLLDTAGLLAGIEKYSAERLRQRSSSPKFLVHNTALISAQRSESFNRILQQKDQWGRIVESAIGAHLMNHALTEDFSLHYWRHGNHEVDFVLQKNGKIAGIEVKSGIVRKAKGMEEFRKTFSPDKIILIGEGGLPWQEFLRMNPAEIF